MTETNQNDFLSDWKRHQNKDMETEPMNPSPSPSPSQSIDRKDGNDIAEPDSIHLRPSSVKYFMEDVKVLFHRMVQRFLSIPRPDPLNGILDIDEQAVNMDHIHGPVRCRSVLSLSPLMMGYDHPIMSLDRTMEALNHPTRFAQSIGLNQSQSQMSTPLLSDSSILSKQVIHMALSQKTLFELYDEFKAAAPTWDSKQVYNYLHQEVLANQGQ